MKKPPPLQLIPLVNISLDEAIKTSRWWLIDSDAADKNDAPLTQRDVGVSFQAVVPHGLNVGLACFTEEDLRTLHPSLSASLRYQFQKSPTVIQFRKAVQGHLVATMVEYVRNPPQSIPAQACTYLEHDHLSDNIARYNYFEQTENALNTVSCTFYAYNLEETPCGVRHAVAMSGSSVEIAPQWLNLHHPGWQDRYNAAKLLGMDATVVAHAVFQTGPLIAQREQHSVDLPEVLSV